MSLFRFFQRSSINREMEEELRSHIQHRADDLERSGIARSEAERQAEYRIRRLSTIQGRMP